MSSDVWFLVCSFKRKWGVSDRNYRVTDEEFFENLEFLGELLGDNRIITMYTSQIQNIPPVHTNTDSGLGEKRWRPSSNL
jgi:hypothetical protein